MNRWPRPTNRACHFAPIHWGVPPPLTEQMARTRWQLIGAQVELCPTMHRGAVGRNNPSRKLVYIAQRVDFEFDPIVSARHHRIQHLL